MKIIRENYEQYNFVHFNKNISPYNSLTNITNTYVNIFLQILNDLPSKQGKNMEKQS